MNNARKVNAHKVKRLEARDSVLRNIASLAGFQTLETRNSDALDFREIAVWTMRTALEAAFEAGRKSVTK